ncbi:glutathione-dependent formaldehyde-activating enzyme [Colletotrichum orchidophilum]|uniref:Glutathione-dependent formaldehyde-activating enzyme n=1 Tax=Colletotrichum orchidophilum TaxID=1209926 RepID=A0A1G4ANF8_9PEZI|nr:glutathione-dependent formaldehyde-activating enzyme [Colletotrichum orchidophilum]OHE90728.1 glutathione-dependent formaldehyde-activating enzyme [Colletotrichum orchidophilum]
MTTTEEPKRTYRGNCHCKAFVYEVELPEIKSASACNCSICSKKGTLWVQPKRDDLRFVKGAEADLSTYNFGPGQITHKVSRDKERVQTKIPSTQLTNQLLSVVSVMLTTFDGQKFCGNCATPIMADSPKGIVLNVRSIQDLDIFGMEKTTYDGLSYGAKYESHAHKGPEPTAKVEVGKLYTGSCHCGALTVAVVSKPIDETYEDRIIECNCSICERNGYVWVYPNADQVVLTGDDDKIGRYIFGHHILAKTFCKTCGVSITNQSNTLTDEEQSALVERAQFWYKWSKTLHPVNVRVLDGVDLKSLKVLQVDGKTEHQPGYVNP